MSKKGAARRKPGIGAKLLLGVVTMERRREVVRAVNSQEGRIQLLLEKEAKETK